MEQTTNQEEQIFIAALELEPGIDRLEFLKKRCGNDESLRQRVEELLEFHQRGDNILDDTSGGFLKNNLADTDSLGVGSQVGPYKLLQEIGVGGMGVVYMAEQSQPVRRKVAVKIIKLGMDTRNVIARFEAERQALAMMDHPNITKVLDAGCTPTGRPYFVMELVTGLAITDYCDREKLSVRDRIELFHQVCVGVKHAHQKGIIHRDLKPSNVMVTHYDGVPVPKIIDFGIAKAVDQTLTEKTLFTSYGNMIGTPEYMSPEQAEMSGQDIDTRADVYSLGVLMYELLTGTTPFQHWKKKGIHKFCEAICNEEPELASTRVNNLLDTVDEVSRNRGTDIRSLQKTLRGDMDWILAKCMSKKRSERYETAADLARDVRNYLDGQPIEAVGPNLGYKTKKFIRKHRASMTFAAIILLTLISSTIVSTVFAIKATKSNQLANLRLQEIDRARKEAEVERDRALAAETKLEEMVEQSRLETAHARALEKLSRNKEKPNNFMVFQPQKSEHGAATVWVHGESDAGHAPQVIALGHANHDVSPNIEIFEVESTDRDDATHTDGVHQHSYRVFLNDTGKIIVDQGEVDTENEFTFEKHPNGDVKQIVVIRDKAETKRFLNLVANERREKFGPHHEVVADAIYEIGNMSFDDQDWSDAENQFREYRDILKASSEDEAQMAKIELLIGKAQLRQQKHALAKETFKQGVGRLAKIGQVPDEIIEVMREIEDLNITDAQIHEMIPDDLHRELRKKLEIRQGFDHDVDIEVRKKK